MGAGTTDPVTAFTIVGVISVFAALAAAGLLVRLGTRSTIASLGAQAVLVVGPLAKLGLIPRITFLDLGSLIQADILALAFFLAGLCALIWTSRDDRARYSAVAGFLLAAAALTRYAYLGAVFGAALVLLIRWRQTRDRRDRRNFLAAAAASLAAPIWIAGYQFATNSGPAKQLHPHLTSVAPMGRLIAAWFGVNLQNAAIGTGIVLVLVVGSGLLAVLRATVFLRLCAASLFGYLVVHILTVQFLDASYAFAAERTLPLVRVLVLVIVADAIVRGLRSFGGRRSLIITLAMLGVWLALTGDAPFSASLAKPWSESTKAQMNPTRLPLLASLADVMYSQLREPVVGLPLATEDSTGGRRAVRRDATDLVAVLRQRAKRFLVLIPPSFLFDGIQRNQWPACATTGSLPSVADIQRYELDIEHCSRALVRTG